MLFPDAANDLRQPILASQHPDTLGGYKYLPFPNQLPEFLRQIALQRLCPEASLKVLQFCLPRLGIFEEVGLLGSSLGVVNTLHELLLVWLLSNEITVLEAMGGAAEDIYPLIVFAGTNSVRFG